MVVKKFNLFFGEILDIDQPVAGALQSSNYFIELEVNGERVLVL